MQLWVGIYIRRIFGPKQTLGKRYTLNLDTKEKLKRRKLITQLRRWFVPLASFAFPAFPLAGGRLSLAGRRGAGGVEGGR